MKNLILHRSLSALSATFIAATFWTSTANAQDPPGEAEAPAAVTAGDAGIPVDHLTLLLTPLTKGETLAEVAAWRDLLRGKAREISAQEIASRESSGEEKAAALKALKGLRAEKAALLKRFSAAVNAYEQKGGDPAEYRKYADAVSSIDVDIKDAGAFWSAVSGWLTSQEGGLRWGANLLKFIAIVFAFWIIARIVGRVVRKALSVNESISHLLKQFINSVVERTILLVGVLVALATIGFNVGALLALIGGGAFVLGFALQDTLGNFAAGLMLLIYRPFDVGDAVEVGGVNGKVDNVSLVTTTIRTFDNKVVLVPNKKVWGEIITNSSSSKERRVDLIFGIGYEDDIAQAQEILERLVGDHELILAEPQPIIRVHELADSSVNFICRPWAKTPDYWTVHWDLTRTVKEEFDRAQISIPFPQQDVHIHTETAKSEKEKAPGKKGTAKKRDEKEGSGDTKGIAPNDE